ncbi:LexA family protein [Brevibacterium aurantiacum]|uniref:SOS response UmuD protein. Serine peptidase. MEROPS family S24 n=1 Tax=Brevibacterium aurantiacum TaxID=273384 RepID=A0A2H1KAY6_BREAU|nr:translesion error-prone DNA polymerase V autoproteolytic subunit [Brevibacterium aurantiacum]SMX96704.1 SOS response UmuD protein. Serine peptidase. MEROPS family S24 [Brevibacterium aurantiacum]
MTLTVLPLKARTPLLLVFPVEAIRAGFPSPAQDYADSSIDLNEELIRDKTATFIVRVAGDSMEGAGIFDGDEIIVDRSLNPRSGDVVVAVIDGELTLKRLILDGTGAHLEAENAAYPPIRIDELSELTIWGVVTFGIRHVR